jgi:uncharacterized protein (DUF1684 family)
VEPVESRRFELPTSNAEAMAFGRFGVAYQPSCSYDPRWTCPLAPPANRLEVGVRAGERLAPT